MPKNSFRRENNQNFQKSKNGSQKQFSLFYFFFPMSHMSHLLHFTRYSTLVFLLSLFSTIAAKCFPRYFLKFSTIACSLMSTLEDRIFVVYSTWLAIPQGNIRANRNVLHNRFQAMCEAMQSRIFSLKKLPTLSLIQNLRNLVFNFEN